MRVENIINEIMRSANLTREHVLKTIQEIKYEFEDTISDERALIIYGEDLGLDFSKFFHFNTQFRINDYITLKFEHGETNIYVNDHLFQQCKYLLLNIPVNETWKFDEIESIDEAAEVLDRSMEGDGRFYVDISPDTEFWAHCSNLQAWVENNYDTRILHSNLAFPLLKQLTDVGDPQAKKCFKEEIAKRLESGCQSVKLFLEETGYLNYLSEEELRSINPSYADYGYERRNRNRQRPPIHNREVPRIRIEHPSFVYRHSMVERIPNIERLMDNTNIERLYLDNNRITEIEGLDNFHNLQVLDLGNNQISEIKGLERLTNLRILYLGWNNISKIEGLDNLKQLEILDLNDNRIEKIEGLEKLVNLRQLRLYHNNIDLDVLHKFGKIAYVERPIDFIEYCRELSNYYKEIERENPPRIVYASRIKEYINSNGFRVSKNVIKKMINNILIDFLDSAIRRARENGRTTILYNDF